MKISLPNFALFKRSLLLDNRHWQSYLYRFAMLGAILWSLLAFFTSRATSLRSAVGLDFLMFIGEINLVFITFIGISIFTSAITEEKEVDSLGLLMMTGISPLSMLLSKGTGKLILGLLLVISQFPFVLLSVTLGGVTTYQVASVFVTLLVYMVLLNNLALLLSVVCKRTATAAAIALAIVATFNILVPIFNPTRWLSPFSRISSILQTFSNEPIWGLQATVYISLSVLCFVLSYILFDHCCTKHTQASSPARLPKGIRHARWNLCRVRRCWGDSIAWKAFYFDAKGKYAMILVQVLLLIIIAVVIIIFSFVNIDVEFIGATMLVVGIITLFIEGIYICDSLFHSEVWSNTLSTLLTTPHSIQVILWSKIAGSIIIIIPTLIMTGLGALMSPGFLNHFNHSDFLFVIIITALSIIFYYQLVILFSVIMKYGGFIIAYFAHGLVYAIFAIPIGLFINFTGLYYTRYLIPWIVILSYIPLIIIMNILIIKKIRSAATT